MLRSTPHLFAIVASVSPIGKANAASIRKLKWSTLSDYYRCGRAFHPVRRPAIATGRRPAGNSKYVPCAPCRALSKPPATHEANGRMITPSDRRLPNTA